jgi:hypothetical protein
MLLYILQHSPPPSSPVVSFIDRATPLGLALFLSFVGVAAVVIGDTTNLANEQDETKRRQKALSLIYRAIPQNLCLAAFSFDIWAITTMFTGDDTTLATYHLQNKGNAIQLLIVAHLVAYIFVLGWGAIVRKKDEGSVLTLDSMFSGLAILGCILLQAC